MPNVFSIEFGTHLDWLAWFTFRLWFARTSNETPWKMCNTHPMFIIWNSNETRNSVIGLMMMAKHCSFLQLIGTLVDFTQRFSKGNLAFSLTSFDHHFLHNDENNNFYQNISGCQTGDHSSSSHRHGIEIDNARLWWMLEEKRTTNWHHMIDAHAFFIPAFANHGIHLCDG